VLPYYLHQLDRVQGAAHFEVPDEQARALHRALAARLSGYLCRGWCAK
jgi:L-lysine 2,3-aminomutase